MKDIEKTLSGMSGKSYMYNARTYKILNHYTNNDTITIATDKNLINIKLANASAELDNFLPVSEEGGAELVVVGKNRSELTELVSILKSNIELVKNDVKNIPKAKEINNSVKNIIEVAKLEIEAVKLNKSLQ